MSKCTKEMQRLERALEHTNKNLSKAQQQLRQQEEQNRAVEERVRELDQIQYDLKRQTPDLQSRQVHLEERERAVEAMAKDLVQKDAALEVKRTQMWDMMKSQVAQLEQQKLKAEQALQRCALELLFAQTQGKNWNRKLNWPVAFEPGRPSTPGIFLWEGVESDMEGRVTGLKLDSNEMHGKL